MTAARTARLQIQAGLADLPAMRDFVYEQAQACGIESTIAEDIALAVNEIATNCLVHGYDRRAGPIELEAGLVHDAFVVRVRDKAPPFDPTQVPPPNLKLPLHRRPLGGMGLHMTRQLVDEMHYSLTAQGGNELTLIKHRVQ